MANETKHLKGLELHSEPVQEILGRPPKWLIRSGISIITAVIVIILIGCHFIKYPEILQATITINAYNLPAQVKARSSGRIDTLFVSEGQTVDEGYPLALIENAANYQDVLFLKNCLENVGRDSAWQTSRDMHLGNLQEYYLAYAQASNDISFFIDKDYINKIITFKKSQIAVLAETLRNQEERLRISNEQLAVAKSNFAVDSTLYSEGALAKIPFNDKKKTFMQLQMTHQSLKSETDNIRLSLLQSQQSIAELEQNYSEQYNNLTLNLSVAREQLEARIRQWEKDYLVISPIKGKVALTKDWQRNQNITAGETMLTVIPTEKSSYFGKIYIPQRGTGKVKEQQKVNIKLDDYPYMEFGFVQVTLSSISMLPYSDPTMGNVYAMEVTLPDTLVTQYGIEIPYRPEMTGTAEIITEDLTVLNRLINPIKAVLKR